MLKPRVFGFALGCAGVALGLILHCALPFAALAIVAARTLSRRFAVFVVVATWLLDQAIGFGVRHYPLDPVTIGWGIAIGIGAVAATLVATMVRNLVLGAVAAFAMDQAVLFVFAGIVRDAAAVSPPVVGQVALANAAGVLVLLAFAVLAGPPVRGLDGRGRDRMTAAR